MSTTSFNCLSKRSKMSMTSWTTFLWPCQQHCYYIQNVHDVMDNTSLNMSTAFILCPKCLWRHRQHFLDISTVFLLCLKYPWGHRQHFSDISTVFLLCPKYLWRHRQHFSDLSTAFLDPSIIINICYLLYVRLRPVYRYGFTVWLEAVWVGSRVELFWRKNAI